jgi:outer membrane protein assembly factor BamB
LASAASFTEASRELRLSRATRLSQAGLGIYLYSGMAEALPIVDVDGDRAEDVLEIRGTAAKGPAVAVRSGRTGRQKWQATSSAMYAVQYVPLPGGHPFVLTFSVPDEGEDAILAFAGTSTFTVKAYDAATGTQVWNRDWTGVLSFTPASATMVGLTMPGGVLTTRPGGHPTLLIDSFDEIYTDLSDTLRSHVEYVDLLTGESTGTTRDVQGNATFDPVGDLDADGTEDVVEVAAAGSVSALSGGDAHVLWTMTAESDADMGWATRAADMTGDRRSDVFAWTGTLEDSTGSVVALDGRTGRRLWQRNASGARSMGDVDHDGRSETRLYTSLGGAVRYTAVTSTGRSMWSTTVTPTVPRTSALSWLAGDLDGDGLQDSYVRLVDRSEPPGSIGKRSFVVDGRTGRLTEHADWGIPLGARLDRRGDDFARTSTALVNGSQQVLLTAVDGRTGRPLWQRRLPVDSTAALTDVWGGSFTTTRRTDLLAVLTEADRAVVVVQDGRTGRTSWSGAYDILRGGKPTY